MSDVQKPNNQGNGGSFVQKYQQQHPQHHRLMFVDGGAHNQDHPFAEQEKIKRLQAEQQIPSL